MSPLSSDDKRFLLQLARRTIKARLEDHQMQPPLAGDLTPGLREPAGAFVTLHIGGELRGCVGIIEPRLPLYRTVMDAAVSAAFADPRFPSLTVSELDELEIEISVLSK